MKKQYLFIIASAIVNLSAFAQPVLNSNDFTSFYDCDIYTHKNVPNLEPGNGGANQTWDFSGLPTLIFDRKFSLVPYATSPYAGTFPSANLAFKVVSSTKSDPSYSYYKLTSSNLETVGAEDSSGPQLEMDHYILFEFPYTYNMVLTDTYVFQDDPTVITATTTFDGYGTLITPYGTFTNVIRQKSVQNYSNAITTTFYNWYTTNPFKTIMSLTFITGFFSSNSADVYTNYTSLGLNDFEQETVISLFPNPASTTLNLRLPNNVIIEKIIIVDAMGKIVLEQYNNANEINVENLNSGIYLIQVYSGDEKFQSKFIKK